MRSGFVGGWLGYRLVRAVAGSPPRHETCSGNVYADRSKLEVLLGPDIWTRLEGKVVVDFGCGIGETTSEIARHGVAHAVGLDIRDDMLQRARRNAARAGVADRCTFTTHVDEAVDAIVSTDSFEHFSDPEGVLAEMLRMLKPGGRVFVAFGCPWYHAYGGHTFSVFPWAHLVFTEKALIRWRSEFTSDGATRFCEVAGGLNGMTVHRFQTLVTNSGFVVEDFETLPIRQVPFRPSGVFREFLTSVVRCRLRRPKTTQEHTEGSHSISTQGLSDVPRGAHGDTKADWPSRFRIFGAGLVSAFRRIAARSG